MACQARRPLREREATARGMDAAALPVRVGETIQDREHLAAAALKRAERLPRVAALVLTLLRPPIRIERMTRLEAPRRQLVGARADHEDRGLVERNDRVEANLKPLLDVAQVAAD